MDPLKIFLSENTPTINFPESTNFTQNPKYVTAVNNLRKDFLKLSFDNKENTRDASLRALMSQGSLDFNSVRRAVAGESEGRRGERSRSGAAAEYEERRHQLINKIESIMAEVLKDINSGKHPKFIIRNQRIWSNCVFEEKIKLKESDDAQMVVVNFGSPNSKEKFCLIIHLLAVLHRMLVKQTTCTRRELYYQHVARLRSQDALDRAVRDVCCVLQAPPWELGLLASAKGLLAGPLRLRGPALDLRCTTSGGVLIPQDVMSITSAESSAKFILVVEKDAVFQKLLDEGAMERLGPFIMITGKGYPDATTRLLLRRLVLLLRLPALALVDADPHGIEIMCTYRFGSLGMSHLAESLAVPSLRWLGVLPSEVSSLGASALTLTSRDAAKARDLLGRPYCSGRLARELRLMLTTRGKAETEAVATLSQAYLTDTYLPHKISAHDFF